ncbi:unnamed protein product, partial [Mesorhabditis belari]|uniref:Galectin n=1 Tax=Mesorhabditis belari TaxID=2138241 RepID=A0AAF3EFF7_9BILA
MEYPTYDQPYKRYLIRPVKVGEVLHLLGKVAPNPYEFCLNLSTDRSPVLQICLNFLTTPIPLLKYIVLDENGPKSRWNVENPFRADRDFDLRLRFLKGAIEIFANQKPMGHFTAPDNFDIRKVALLGHVESLRLFKLYGEENEVPFEAKVDFFPNQTPRIDLAGLPKSFEKTHRRRMRRKFGVIGMGAGGKPVIRKPPTTSRLAEVENRAPSAHSRSPQTRYFTDISSKNAYLMSSSFDGYINNTNITSSSSSTLRARRIDIDFLDHTGNRSFQLSIRFDEGAIVRNSFYFGEWQNEERDGGMPIDAGKIFDLTIFNNSDQLEIFFNGRHFCDFRHREKSWALSRVRIEGDLELHWLLKNGIDVTE